MSIAIDPDRLGVQKVVDALEGSDEPHLLTGDQYGQVSAMVGASSAPMPGDRGRHRSSGDQRGQHASLGMLDMQHDSVTHDALTYVGDDGARRAIGWQVPTTRATSGLSEMRRA